MPPLEREEQRGQQVADLLLRACNLCPRECGARRLDGEKGYCGAGPELIGSGYHPHFVEERPLVGRGTE